MLPLHPNLNYTTHWEPSGSVPGPHFLDQQDRQCESGRFPGVLAADLARLRRATAACMDAGGSSTEGCGGKTEFRSSRCNRPYRWTVGAEEMRDEDHIEIEQLLSPEDVARACGLSRRAIYRAIARGELRAVRLCHRLRVHPAELERWIAEETCSAEPPVPIRSRGSTGAVRRGSLRAMLDETTEGLS
jgi:excisionase family DNA binding protein